MARGEKYGYIAALLLRVTEANDTISAVSASGAKINVLGSICQIVHARTVFSAWGIFQNL